MDFGSLFLLATITAILPLLLGFYTVYLLKQYNKSKSVPLIALALVTTSFAVTIAYHKMFAPTSVTAVQLIYTECA